MEPSKRLKITVVGDGMVGKTCLLFVYTRNEFPKEYVPTVFDNYVQNVTVDGELVEMTLWDTAGQEDYERLRPLSYNNNTSIPCVIHDLSNSKVKENENILSKVNLMNLTTDCFLVCYSVDNRASYENVSLKWYPELQHFASSVPVVLVATKTDLRAKNETSPHIITTHEGKKLKKKIRAISLVECSALERVNMNEVFEEAVRAALRKKPVNKRACHYL